MQANQVDLSIVIVSWNTHEMTLACLRSIYANAPKRTFEVIVVDNASTDQTVAMIRAEFPQTILFANEQNVGFARANNQAMAHCRGAYILLLNSDTIIEAGQLENLAQSLDAHPTAGVSGPTLLNKDRSFQASYNDFPTVRNEFMAQIGVAKRLISPYFPSYGPTDDDAIRFVDWVGGACFLIRKEVVEQVGMLDDSFFMYGEEMEWCYRIKASGWDVIYAPAVEIIHLGGGSADKVPVWKHVQIQRSKVQFFEKHHSAAVKYAVAAIIRLSALGKALVCTVFPTRFHGWQRSAYWRTARTPMVASQ